MHCNIYSLLQCNVVIILKKFVSYSVILGFTVSPEQAVCKQPIYQAQHLLLPRHRNVIYLLSRVNNTRRLLTLITINHYNNCKHVTA